MSSKSSCGFRRLISGIGDAISLSSNSLTRVSEFHTNELLRREKSHNSQEHHAEHVDDKLDQYEIVRNRGFPSHSTIKDLL